MPSRSRARHPLGGRSRAGRPRAPEADRALLEATLEIVAESGYEGVRVNDVAERAGVAKTTMYRRWPGKSELVLAALRSAPELPDVDTGALRTDLVELMTRFLELAERVPLVELLASLAAERQRHPDLAEALDPYVADRMRPILRALERARARGEIAGDSDVDLAASLFGGAVVLRLLFGGSTANEAIERLADLVAAAIAPG
ncbi:MAG: TetR/AcrR family transcriptional regulator [Myxococcota bacterium]